MYKNGRRIAIHVITVLFRLQGWHCFVFISASSFLSHAVCCTSKWRIWQSHPRQTLSLYSSSLLPIVHLCPRYLWELLEHQSERPTPWGCENTWPETWQWHVYNTRGYVAEFGSRLVLLRWSCAAQHTVLTVFLSSSLPSICPRCLSSPVCRSSASQNHVSTFSIWSRSIDCRVSEGTVILDVYV